MDNQLLPQFEHVIPYDFEYRVPAGEHPVPKTVAAIDIRTGVIKCLRLDTERPPPCPFPTDGRAVWIGYFTTGDLACFKVLGWEIPVRLIDLYPEYHCLVNSGDGYSDAPKEKLGLLDFAITMSQPSLPQRNSSTAI